MSPPVTYIVYGLVLFVVVVGGVVTLTHPHTLDFATYLRDVTIVTAALTLAVGGVRIK